MAVTGKRCGPGGMSATNVLLRDTALAPSAHAGIPSPLTQSGALGSPHLKDGI